MWSNVPVQFDVVPATMEHLDALLAGDESFARAFGYSVTSDYLAFPEALEYSRERLLCGIAPEWSTYLFVDEWEKSVIGMGGYTGPPHEGAVEFGFSICPARQGEGAGTAAARELITRALAAGVSVVQAVTDAQEGQSPSALRRAGMRVTREYIDPAEGSVWLWEIRP